MSLFSTRETEDKVKKSISASTLGKCSHPHPPPPAATSSLLFTGRWKSNMDTSRWRRPPRKLQAIGHGKASYRGLWCRMPKDLSNKLRNRKGKKTRRGCVVFRHHNFTSRPIAALSLFLLVLVSVLLCSFPMPLPRALARTLCHPVSLEVAFCFFPAPSLSHFLPSFYLSFFRSPLSFSLIFPLSRIIISSPPQVSPSSPTHLFSSPTLGFLLRVSSPWCLSLLSSYWLIFPSFYPSPLVALLFSALSLPLFLPFSLSRFLIFLIFLSLFIPSLFLSLMNFSSLPHCVLLARSDPLSATNWSAPRHLALSSSPTPPSPYAFSRFALSFHVEIGGACLPKEKKNWGYMGPGRSKKKCINFLYAW